LQKAEDENGRWYPNFSASIFPLHMCGFSEEAVQPTHSADAGFEMCEYDRQNMVTKKNTY